MKLTYKLKKEDTQILISLKQIKNEYKVNFYNSNIDNLKLDFEQGSFNNKMKVIKSQSLTSDSSNNSNNKNNNSIFQILIILVSFFVNK